MHVAYTVRLLQGEKNSATKEPFVELAIHASKFMMSMTNNALLYPPCLGVFAYKSQNKFPAVISESKLNKELNWKDHKAKIKAKIPITDFLYMNNYKNYCQDLFDETNKQNFMKMLEVPCMTLDNSGANGGEIWESDESVKLRLPFFISY